jgi:hypothetical protein
MAIRATIVLIKSEFVATLSDGSQVRRSDFRLMAEALVLAGVRADDIEYDWKPGQRMITAGQQVGLRSEMVALQRKYWGGSAAA